MDSPVTLHLIDKAIYPAFEMTACLFALKIAKKIIIRTGVLQEWPVQL